MNRKKDFAVKVVGIVSNLEARMREVTLLSDKYVFPYRSAQISLEEIVPRDIKITSFYALKENLTFIRILRQKLLDQGYDIFHLTQGLVIQINEEDPREIVPPVVEVENDIPFILDGLHRAFVADAIGSSLSVMVVRSALTQSYALPNEWSEIIIRQEVPKNPLEKKRYKEGYRSLYRDLPGTGGIRMNSK
ncbi:MAG: hypothetical protein ACD_15C00024G0007 [uncultured bacterium]|nr:MAG: hypothetical protein ACD_15C00024G0007 [uncultured bacterium]